MRIGIFADSHDHLDHIRLAVNRFNQEQCTYVIFAGDLVSTTAVPPLRSLECPLIGCFGDNEGNRLVVSHMERQLRGLTEPFDVAICGHTHKPKIGRDEHGRLHINPGETGGWSFGRPTVALLETGTRQATLVHLVQTEAE